MSEWLKEFISKYPNTIDGLIPTLITAVISICGGVWGVLKLIRNGNANRKNIVLMITTVALILSIMLNIFLFMILKSSASSKTPANESASSIAIESVPSIEMETNLPDIPESQEEMEETAPATNVIKDIRIKEVSNEDSSSIWNNYQISFVIENNCQLVTVRLLDNNSTEIENKEFPNVIGGKENQFIWSPDNAAISQEASILVEVKADDCIENQIIDLKKRIFSGGTGTKDNPYLIATIDDFKNVNSYKQSYFRQIKDLDFDNNQISSLFTSDDPFIGTYDGDNHIISNITVTYDKNKCGIFSKIGKGGLVCNLVIEKCTFIGSDGVAAIVGENDGKIEACTVRNSSFSGKAQIAAIAGYNNGNILNSKSSKNSISSTESTTNGSGGICGFNKGSIIGCVSKSNNIASFNYPGGIVAINRGSVQDCSASDLQLKKTNHYGGSDEGGIVANNKGGGVDINVINCHVDGDLKIIGDNQ